MAKQKREIKALIRGDAESVWPQLIEPSLQQSRLADKKNITLNPHTSF